MTDNQGRLRVYITNTKAGSEDYTFSINNSSVTKQLLFKPDESTATITDSQLKIVADGQKADGTSVNRCRRLFWMLMVTVSGLHRSVHY